MNRVKVVPVINETDTYYSIYEYRVVKDFDNTPVEIPVFVGNYTLRELQSEVKELEKEIAKRNSYIYQIINL